MFQEIILNILETKCNLLNKATRSNPFGSHTNVCHINTAEGATRHANPQFRLKHITCIHVPDPFKCMSNYNDRTNNFALILYHHFYKHLLMIRTSYQNTFFLFFCQKATTI